MPLNGLGRPAVKPAGGIVSVELVAAAAFKGAEYDPESGCFTSVETSEPFAAYVFREDCAAYTEEASGAAGQPLVKHVLKMEFPGGPETDKAVGELSALDATGFAAIVTTGEGQRLLAGYSRRFGTQYPLRLAKVSSGSGSHPSDFPSVTVMLESTDTEYSKLLHG